MNVLLEEGFPFVICFILEIVFVRTGEMVLFGLSFGKHKPRWDMYTRVDARIYVLLSELSFWIGIAFWLAVPFFIYWISRS